MKVVSVAVRSMGCCLAFTCTKKKVEGTSNTTRDLGRRSCACSLPLSHEIPTGSRRKACRHVGQRRFQKPRALLHVHESKSNMVGYLHGVGCKIFKPMHLKPLAFTCRPAKRLRRHLRTIQIFLVPFRGFVQGWPATWNALRGGVVQCLQQGSLPWSCNSRA
jgi:hypothetical protein